mmetsp:Transcript_18489/g.53021  ORF Transcript_18489/g.53021 Transcript_18489/m.53021 type:complete len:219 (+) Transcript_18489:487-1143(+)
MKQYDGRPSVPVIEEVQFAKEAPSLNWPPRSGTRWRQAVWRQQDHRRQASDGLPTDDVCALHSKRRLLLDGRPILDAKLGGHRCDSRESGFQENIEDTPQGIPVNEEPVTPIGHEVHHDAKADSADMRPSQRRDLRSEGDAPHQWDQDDAQLGVNHVSRRCQGFLCHEGEDGGEAEKGANDGKSHRLLDIEALPQLRRSTEQCVRSQVKEPSDDGLHS